MDENNIIKKKNNKNNYRRPHNRHYYHNKKKKNLIYDNNDTQEIKNILLYNETTKEELPKVEIPVIKAYELLKEKAPDYEEEAVVPIKTKKKKNKKIINLDIFNNKVLKYGMSFAVLLIVIFGSSYSYFNYTKEDSRQADIASGEVYVKIVEDATNITLDKMYPRTDEEARSRNDNYFDFTVKAKNTSETREIEYQINIINGEDVTGKTRIDPKYIKIDLQEKVNNEYVYVEEGVLLTNFHFENIVPVNTTNEITKEYRLRLWVNDDIIISDTIPNASYTQTEFSNLYANFNLSLDSVDKAYGSITTCPNCKFLYSTELMYTTWNTEVTLEPGTNEIIPAPPTVISSGLYLNYHELVNTTHKDYFFGVILNDNNEVTDIYVCGIKNNIPYCLRDSHTANKYEENKGIVQRSDLWNNTCTTTTNNPGTSNEFEMISCGPWDNTIISVSGNSYGPIQTGLTEHDKCTIIGSGSFRCYVPS